MHDELVTEIRVEDAWSLTGKHKTNKDENTNFHEENVKYKMTQVVVPHAVVDPRTMAVASQLLISIMGQTCQKTY